MIGYKPSFGEISRVGVKLQSGTLDTVGVMARALDDLPLIRAVVMALATDADRPHGWRAAHRLLP
ncbi:MAG: amidase family protein [Pseudomonadota bacterium]